MAERGQQKPGRWVWDVLLLSFVLLSLVMLRFLFVLTAYIEGLGLRDFWWVPTCVVFLFGPAAFIGFCVRAFHLWGRSNATGRIVRVLSALAPVLAFGGWIAYSRATAAHHDAWRREDRAYLYGVRTRMRHSVDFSAIRTWAKANPGWHDEVVDSKPVETKRPTCIRSLRPLYASVSEDGATTWLEFSPGSVLVDIHDRLVLCIGPRDAPLPEPGARAISVAPGAFVGLFSMRAALEGD